jgi:anti-sigma factor RsiW
MTMNRVPQDVDDKLLDYLDGKPGQSAREIETLLTSHPEIRARLNELKAVHAHLAGQSVQEPSRDFTRRVMENLRKHTYAGKLRLGNTLLLLMGVLVATGIGVILLSGGSFDSLGGQISPQDISLGPNFRQTLPAISISGRLVMNVIIVLNLGLALLILDRGILKPWFERRRLGY